VRLTTAEIYYISDTGIAYGFPNVLTMEWIANNCNIPPNSTNVSFSTITDMAQFGINANSVTSSVTEAVGTFDSEGKFIDLTDSSGKIDTTKSGKFNCKLIK